MSLRKLYTIHKNIFLNGVIYITVYNFYMRVNLCGIIKRIVYLVFIVHIDIFFGLPYTKANFKLGYIQTGFECIFIRNQI